VTSPPVAQVEVWTDPQCIWCYITHPRLDAAIAAYGGGVEVTYRSFQLHPEAPVDVDRDEHIRAQTNGMSTQELDRILDHLTGLAAAEGLAHRPDLVQPTNSRLALELLAHSDTLGLRDSLTRRLTRAHFAEGRNIGHLDELLTLAAEVGLDLASASSALTNRTHSADVDRDIANAAALGAQGVPFYVFNSTNALGGVQSTDELLNALRSPQRV
jgi:predicted DsbA family dithiol-disulfide isomerase